MPVSLTEKSSSLEETMFEDYKREVISSGYLTVIPYTLLIINCVFPPLCYLKEKSWAAMSGI